MTAHEAQGGARREVIGGSAASECPWASTVSVAGEVGVGKASA